MRRDPHVMASLDADARISSARRARYVRPIFVLFLVEDAEDRGAIPTISLDCALNRSVYDGFTQAESLYQHMPLLMGYMNQTETLNSLENFEQNLGEIYSFCLLHSRS